MKYKNYGFWTSLTASAVVVAGMLQKAYGLEISSEILTDIIMGIAGILVVFGIVKIPKTKDEEQSEEKDFESEKNEQEFDLETKKAEELKTDNKKSKQEKK